VAHSLLRQNVMVTATTFSTSDRKQVLRFAASFLWADLEVADSERRFLNELARELDVHDAPTEVEALLSRPPVPEEIDPTSVTPAVADFVRQAALRAIAADGRVATEEMMMFELLDDLLPKSLQQARGSDGERESDSEAVGPPDEIRQRSS
jgi:hypothetical protein